MPLLRSQGNANVFVATVTPANANNGDLWIDTSGATNQLKVNTGGTFALVSQLPLMAIAVGR